MAKKKKKETKKKEKNEKKEDKVSTSAYKDSYPARVIEVIGRTGVRGEVIQVRCKILAGHDKGKAIRRNVRGPIRVNDILLLRNTEFEASALSGRRR